MKDELLFRNPLDNMQNYLLLYSGYTQSLADNSAAEH
jgi:hypothetical protein